MKKYDIVSLTNEEPYKSYGIKRNTRGVVLECGCDYLSVLFFNPDNDGDYLIAKISVKDVITPDEKLPRVIIDELNAKLSDLKFSGKTRFKPSSIKAYDQVELCVEKPEYAEQGIHKGAVGCVMDDKAVHDYIEVDFSYVDENGEYSGDCIGVRISDLKKVKD